MMEILSFEEQAELAYIDKTFLISDYYSANKLLKKGLIEHENDNVVLTERGLWWLKAINS